MSKEKYSVVESENAYYIADNEEDVLLNVAVVVNRLNDYEHRLANCIEPKFKIGQEVSVVDNLSEEIYVGQIVFIEAQKYKDEKESIIWYQVEYFDECTMSGPFEESFTFATEAEAKAKLGSLKDDNDRT